MQFLKKVLVFLKKIVLSSMFLVGLAVLSLFACLYYVNSWRVAGDATVTRAVPAIVAEQLSDPAVVESFRGEQGHDGPVGPEGSQGPIGLQGEQGIPGEPGICPDCATTATATKVPDPASTATATLASAKPTVLVYQPVTVNGRGAPAGKIPTGGGSWTVTNGGTVINAPVTVN